jgi:hypothetical protein
MSNSATGTSRPAQGDGRAGTGVIKPVLRGIVQSVASGRSPLPR